MSSQKLIVILGATGNQGGSVATTFLQDPDWKVRALTRNASSTKAQALASRGAEVVEADLDKPSTLAAAFEGANAVFAVSDFWGLYGDPANKEKAKPGQALNEWAGEHETLQLKNAIDAAAKVSTLERFIISALSDATKWSQGKYKHVYHFDSKAKAVVYAKEIYPELWAKTSVYQAGLFLGNFVQNPLTQPIKASLPTPNADGVVQFIGHIEQDVKLPFIAAEEDSGPFVKALLQQPAGVNLIGYREWISPREAADALTRATGLKAEVVTLPKGQFPPDLDPDLRAELEDNFAYFNEFGYEGRDDPSLTHPRDLKFPPSLKTCEDYFKKQDWSKVFGA
ncbi:hypothetical protein CEP52_004113 [Fusarium oligoseptatum]|uniref:NmrA-like domain-containing protein n=1 Tax=Fusarium oligoseptatum TaxID=2604345 RepID=A0A428U5C0_9HYPO|nr:hypothetical protein CEP52_004113 [Fusarium oligoseptatum]